MFGLVGGFMFTGLIEHQGEVLANNLLLGASRLVISSPFSELKTGESISVNGACLTLVPSSTSELHFDLSPETLGLTNLRNLSPGDFVNLERAMLASTRFGGHYVTGHVDATALLQSVVEVGEYIELTVTGFDSTSMAYLIPKGSITMEGVSLTINAVTDNSIKLMLVPHTLSNTNLQALKVGQRMNIEFDYLARIVAHQLKHFGTLNYEVTL
jgi:riboflavin synthase